MVNYRSIFRVLKPMETELKQDHTCYTLKSIITNQEGFMRFKIKMPISKSNIPPQPQDWYSLHNPNGLLACIVHFEARPFLLPWHQLHRLLSKMPGYPTPRTTAVQYPPWTTTAKYQIGNSDKRSFIINNRPERTMVYMEAYLLCSSCYFFWSWNLSSRSPSLAPDTVIFQRFYKLSNPWYIHGNSYITSSCPMLKHQDII